MRQHETLIGTQLGAYRVQERLGEGGMAWVYRAYHERLRREVALKVIRPDVSAAGDFAQRFEQEAQMIARLQHRHIVGVYDFGEEQGITFLSMQLVQGGSLRQYLQGQPLDARLAVLYAIQVAQALQHAHKHGIVHRDIKPANMLLVESGKNELLLSDFGIAKMYESLPENTLRSLPSLSSLATEFVITKAQMVQTSVGTMTGTPAYMAPEQWLGKPVDACTDIYALGVVLYEMLTGQVPFRAQNSLGLGYLHVSALPQPPRSLQAAIPESVERIVLRMLAKLPQERITSAEEVERELRSLLEPVKVSQRYEIQGQRQQVEEPSRRINWRRLLRPRNIAIVVLLVVIAVQIFNIIQG